MKKYLVIIFYFASQLNISVHAQKNEFKVALVQGINKTLLRQQYDTRIGYNSSVGITFKHSIKNSKVTFEPSLLLIHQAFYSKFDNYLTVKNTQVGFNLIITAGFLLNKKMTLKTGLFNQIINSSRIQLTSNYNSAYYSYSNSYLYQNYDPNKLQAGLITALSICIGKSKKTYIDIILQQFATSFLNADYHIIQPSNSSNNKLIFSNKSKPTVVSAALLIKLIKKTKAIEE